MTLPSFLVIGAAKAGTTSLHHYLDQHPQVYMSSRKEVNFFAFEGQKVRFQGPGDQDLCTTVTDLRAYQEYFADVSDEVAVGEAAPIYLYSARAPANIRRHVPEMKLIAILRNPVDRAFSSYSHVLRDEREDLSFEEGLAAEDDRIAQGWEFVWHYQRVGFYAEQVRRYIELFPAEQMRFFLYEDLLSDPRSFLKRIYEFLEVDPTFVADTSRHYNATGTPQHHLTQGLFSHVVNKPNPIKSAAKLVLSQERRYELAHRVYQHALSKPPLIETTRRYLSGKYRDDILTLQEFIGRDLSAWLQDQEARGAEVRP